jgi:hypothetical protein
MRPPTQSKKQSRRVAAWIYAVINPIISSLQREQTLLETGSLTWRPHTGQSELIRAIQEYVDSNQWPNFEDFLSEYPKSPIVSAFGRHDSTLTELNSVAKKLFDWMLADREFQESVDRAFIEYEEIRAQLEPQGPILIHSRAEIPKESAQYVINNVQTLPSHYTFSAFWNSTGRKLLAFRDRREFQPLHRCKDNLGEISARLKQILEVRRLNLSREFDVPAAPVPGVTFEE